jgi:phage/plasmid-associated DNA primase
VKDTGKSLFIELLQKIFGFLGGMANDKVFKLKTSSSSHDTEVFSLEGRRYSSISELSEQEKFNEVLMKKISGGDSLNIRRAGSPINEDVLFSTVLLLATNEIPSFHEEAFAGRMRAISFKNVFVNNPDRKNDILSNINSFFTEFVKGASRYYNNGMNIVDCNEVITSSKTLVNSKNPVSIFWENQDEFEFVDDIKKRVKKVDIWDSFVNSNGKSIMGRNKFYEMFMSLYKKELLDITYRDGKMWTGIQKIVHQSEECEFDLGPNIGIRLM